MSSTPVLPTCLRFKKFEKLMLTNSYVTEEVARSQGLASVVDGSVIMRANAESQASGRGRDSVRISSKDEWADVRDITYTSPLAEGDEETDILPGSVHP